MKSLVDKLYERTCEILKVPVGALDPNGESVIQAFKPAPRYAGYRLCRWVFTQIGIFIPFAIFLLPKDFHGFLEQFGFGWIRSLDFNVYWQEKIPEPLQLPAKFLAIGGYAIQFVFSFVSTLFSAKSQSYLLTDHSLRIRSGVRVHQEKSLSLKNIQQVKFSQNILERLWGIGSLEVRTAGGGNTTSKDKKNRDKSHTGELVGLLNPIPVRELVNSTIKNASAVRRPLRTPVDSTRILASEQTPEFDQAINALLLASKSLREHIAARDSSKSKPCGRDHRV